VARRLFPLFPYDRSSRLARALMCVAALGLPLHSPVALAQDASQVRLPALGESAAEDFNVGTERRLGDQIMGEIRRDPDFLDDPVLQEYLQSLWQPLVAAARQRGDIDVDTGAQFAWEAFLVRDRSVNAFALPGGFVGVHLGLIAMTSTRDELASVLAHELTHVTQRHIARGIANQAQQSLIGIAGMLLAILAASRSNSSDAAQAAIMGGQAAAVQGQLNFSRAMEREADRIGYAVLGLAGFDGAGMAGMFGKLDLANRLNDNGAYPYLRSHPLTVERQSEARLRLQGTNTTNKPQPPWLHLLMSARARVLMDASVVQLRRLQDVPVTRPGQGPAERLAGLYGSALASSLLRDHARAERAGSEARQLLAQQPDADPAVQRALWLLDAEGRLAAGDSAGALQQVAAVRQQWPATELARPALLLQAQATLQLQGPNRNDALRGNTEALQTWVAAHPADAMAWLVLGNTAEALGLRLRALRAQAEARLLVGDMTGAIDRLRAGRNLTRQAGTTPDFIEASIIESRLRELESRRRQLAREAAGNRSRGPDREGPVDRGDSEPPAKQPLQAPPSGPSPRPAQLAVAASTAVPGVSSAAR
jgi:beta-barrel assembly-enhancing protease